MSSPIHHPKDLDVSLMYAPPWARESVREPALEPINKLEREPASPLPIQSTAPPVEWPSRSRRPNNLRHTFSGDRAMAEMQRQLTLEPNRLPEPPMGSEQYLLPLVLRMGAVATAAAVVAWAMVSVPHGRQDNYSAVQAGFSPPPSTVDTGKQDPWPAALPVGGGHVDANNVIRPDETSPGMVPQTTPVSASPSTPVSTPQSAPPQPEDKNQSPLDEQEIAMLVKRGKVYLENGDLSSARLLLRRAEEAGSASAALALGATYDPLVLQRLGVVGAHPDVAKAREWYQKAAELGSDAASQQLAKLAQAPQ